MNTVKTVVCSNFETVLPFKGELNPKIKLDLNNSFFTLINKYNPHIF